jgi:NAD kinase
MLGKEILTLLKKSEKRPLVCFKKKKKKKLRFELAALNKFVLSRKKRMIMIRKECLLKGKKQKACILI